MNDVSECEQSGVFPLTRRNRESSDLAFPVSLVSSHPPPEWLVLNQHHEDDDEECRVSCRPLTLALRRIWHFVRLWCRHVDFYNGTQT